MRARSRMANISKCLLLIPVLVVLVRCQVHFDCPQLPPLSQPAKTVHELRPQDIKVVMALGDSITAGFGMMGSHRDIAEDLNEYRGQSWSVGMDKNAQTLANFLKFYTPSIIGGSLGSHVVELCYDVVCPPLQYEPSKDVFNAAQSGAMIPNFVSHEFKYLLEQLKSHSHAFDMKNDWKLMTILIGANDVCLGCSGDVPTLTADDFEKNMRETLEEVRKHIPKLFVNLVLLGNISEVYKLSLKSAHCREVHRILPIECICAFASGKEGDKLRLEMDNLIAEFNTRQMKIAADYAKLNYPDFAVVIQPFFSKAKADNFPVEFLSNLDCFHPSLIAHQNLAKALWNNMITPAAQKRDYFDFTEPFVCPTNTTLLYTD